MSKRNAIKQSLCVLCMLTAAFFLSPDALAYAPLKGSVAAESTDLDRAAYVDGGAFVNAPCPVSTVRIGMRYANSAVEDAQFINEAGVGFAFGEYDADRVFHEKARTDVDNIVWVCTRVEGKWQLTALSAYSHEVIYRAPKERDAVAFVPLGNHQEGTWFRGNLYLGGFECAIDRDYLIRVINCLDLESYVKGVVPYEMSNYWPYEALRAQAVCARTYVVYNQNSYEEYGFDLTDDTECQVYRGVLGANESTDAAVDSTVGQLVRYQGEICEIYYFASDGGATEDGLHVFESARPYLLGKVDPFERAIDYSYRSWEEWRSGMGLSWLLANQGYELSEVIRVQPEYSALGNAVAVNLYDDMGRHVRIAGRDAYTFLRLHNCRYTVSRVGDYFLFQGSGWGHNCGMSQWGARAMAQVYGYDCEDIIRFYFTGAYVA